MGNHQRGTVARHVPQSRLDILFGPGIKRTCRLIQNQQAGVLQNGARNRDSLLFTTRELEAALTHTSRVTIWQARDEIMHLR